MQSHMHDFIINHQPDKLIKYIQENPNYFRGARNQQGLTLLQLAAREGMVDVVLWLLYAGEEVDLTNEEHESDNARNIKQAKKTPLYFAIEYQHTLVTQILLVLGAGLEKVSVSAFELEEKEMERLSEFSNVSSSIIDAILFWQVKNFHVDFQGALFEKMNLEQADGLFAERGLGEQGARIDISLGGSRPSWLLGHMAFAAKKNRTSFFDNQIFNDIEYDPDSLTPAYWAAVNANEVLYDHLCQGDSLKEGTSLYQLKLERQPAFDRFIEKAEKKSQSVGLDLEYKNTMSPIANIPKNIFLAYQAAARSDNKEYQRICRNFDDQCDVLVYAFNCRDFVALETILEKEVGYSFLIKRLLESGNYDFIVFLLVINSINIYDLVVEMGNPSDLKKLLTSNCATQAGILQLIISRGMLRSIPQVENLMIFNIVKMDDKSNSTIFFKCLQDKYPELVAILNIRTGPPYLIQGDISENLYSTIVAFAARFHLTHFCFENEAQFNNAANHYPDDVWSTIFQYADGEDLFTIQKWNQSFDDKIQRFKRGFDWSKNYRVHLLEQKSNALISFIELAENLLSDASYFSNRCNRASLLWSLGFTVVGGSFCTLVYFVNKIADNCNSLVREMKETIDPKTHSNCYDEYVDIPYSGAHYCKIVAEAYKVCADLCNEWDSAKTTMDYTVFGTVTVGVVFSCFILSSISSIKEFFTRDQERFFVNSFAIQISQQLQVLEKMFPGRFSDEFMNLPITTALGRVRGLLDDISTQLDTLASFVSSHSPRLFSIAPSYSSDDDLRQPLLAPRLGLGGS